MKLWMIIMVGWFIYKAFKPTEEAQPQPQTIKKKASPQTRKKKAPKEHTMLPTYYVPAGNAPRRRTEKHLRIAEKATVKQKGMFPEQFINNNTTETDYEEVS